LETLEEKRPLEGQWGRKRLALVPSSSFFSKLSKNFIQIQK